MTGIIKRILSVCITVAMLLSITPLAITAEETSVGTLVPEAAKVVRFTVGEADENGVFVAKLSMHNLQFLAMGFSFSFNKDVIQLVDETGAATDEFSKAVLAYPVVSGEKVHRFTAMEEAISNAEGTIRIAQYIMFKDADTNVVVADEEGFVSHEFRFKKVADGDYGFALLDNEDTSHGKDAVLNDGKETLSFDFEFVYPEAEADKNTSDRYESEAKPSRPSGGNDAANETERLRKERKAGTVVLQINNNKVSLNGALKWVDKDNKNVVPYIENDRTMVPLRFISEALGAEVEWVAETRTIHISLEETKISMQIDNKEYTINGETKEMDVAPVIREDRTFVPLRFVSEALNKSVYWNGVTSIVVIAPLDKPWDDKDPVTQQLMTDTLMMFRWFDEEAYAN